MDTVVLTFDKPQIHPQIQFTLLDQILESECNRIHRDKNFRLRGKRCVLTYLGFIDKERLNQYIAGKFTRHLIKCWVAHIPWGIDWKTYVVVRITDHTTMDCANCTFFDIGDHLATVYQIDARTETVWQKILSALQITDSLTELPPFEHVDLTLPWQKSALCWLLDQQFSASSAIWNISAYDISDSAFEFGKWMQHTYPESTVIFPNNFPSATIVKTTLRNHFKRGWNGKYVIVKLVRPSSHEARWWDGQSNILQLLRHGALTAPSDGSMGSPPAGILILSQLSIKGSAKSGFDPSTIRLEDLDKNPGMLRAPQIKTDMEEETNRDVCMDLLSKSLAEQLEEFRLAEGIKVRSVDSIGLPGVNSD